MKHEQLPERARTWFYHFRDNHQPGGATACLLQVEDEGLYVGLALCSIKDNFCRKTGRNIAATRAVYARDFVLKNVPNWHVTKSDIYRFLPNREDPNDEIFHVIEDGAATHNYQPYLGYKAVAYNAELAETPGHHHFPVVNNWLQRREERNGSKRT